MIQASPYAHTTTTPVGATNTTTFGGTSGTSTWTAASNVGYNQKQQQEGVNNPFLIKKQPTKCRDPIFAVLLYANVAAILGVFLKYGTPVDQQQQQDADFLSEGADSTTLENDYMGLIYSSIATAGFAAVLSAIVLQILMCIPGVLIKVALVFNVILAGIAALVGFIFGNFILGIFGCIFFAIMLCFAKLVWSRIPFATANLKTGCAAIRANCGVVIISYIFTALACGWSILWTLAVAGIQERLITCEQQTNVNGNPVTVCNDPNYGYFFLLFLSFFFTHQVLQNCVHTCVAGVVGSWWFKPESNGCCSCAVFGSFLRTMTTSFGSVCFGSLLVAIIQALRQLAEQARQNEEVGQMLACCIDCILSCIQAVVEYFNKWAFVYVGVYGYGYCEAGKNVIQLFKDRGWEAIIADDLVGMVLFFLSLLVGLVTAGLGVLLVEVTDLWDDFAPGKDAARVSAAVIGLIIGLVICSILMSTIASSVNTSIVLFADAPAEFEKNYPDLSNEMRQAYMVAHPGCF
eukprot:CAMPEP_0176500768 /NCGR_PEP_ID=MMETSP0200_2-20121128/13771_1 /TAXON_ID=947934 /ORGANISM="Chaetoceros sp., Strain GSL56" /LENGTH=517 /DNA_ID=CAMNT_0017899545 /DNA_START=166 /DNA_END=1719 /DNA_ORIENTATION=-